MKNDNLTGYFERPIFLHAVNRELHEAVGQEVNTSNLLHSIRLFSILSCQTMFCNVSQVYEVFYDDPVALLELTELAKLGRFVAHSDYGSLAEFQESREEKFYHSKQKHPAFFEKPSHRLIELPHSSMGLSVSTTGHIEFALRRWIDNDSTSSLDSTLSQIDKKVLRNNETWLDSALSSREQRALTFDLFEQTALVPFARAAEGAIRRALTQAYIDSYIKSFDPRCVWGYLGINQFERFTLLTGLNYKFGQAVLNATGLDTAFQAEPQYSQFQRLLIENSEEMSIFRQRYAELANTFDEMAAPNDTWDIRSRLIVSNIQKMTNSGFLSFRREGKTLSEKILSASKAIRATNEHILGVPFSTSSTGINRVFASRASVKGKKMVEAVEVSSAPMQCENTQTPFLRSHNFLVFAGGLISFILSLLVFPLLMDTDGKTTLALSLGVGLCSSGLAYWLHPDFYYRRMALYGIGVSSIGGLSYNLKISGIYFLGDSRFELGTLSSGIMVFIGLAFSMYCMRLDFKQNRSH